MEKIEFQKKVGRKIQELRISKGLTQVDLASRVSGNFDTTNLSRIESGRVCPSIYTLLRLSNAFEVDLVELIQFINQEN